MAYGEDDGIRMNIEEYNKVKHYDYEGYCKYLIEKYGRPDYDYMTRDFVKISKGSKTKYGLYMHHIKENEAPALSTPDSAKRAPWEFQQAQYLCYCDLLEHLYLHILICEETDVHTAFWLGFGGIVDYFIPELNDIYSGWTPSQEWRQTCHNLVRENEEVYLVLIERFIRWWKSVNEIKYKSYDLKFNSNYITSSADNTYYSGGWTKDKNKVLLRKLDKCIEKVYFSR